MKYLIAASLALLATTNAVDAAPAAAASDPCTNVATQLKNEKLADYVNVQKCLDSFPLDKKVRDATVDTLYKATDGQYAFTDMASIQSRIDGGQWDLKDVDLRASLKSMGKKSYKTDRAFHDELNAMYRALGDAHTMYTNFCYHRAFNFRHPWLYRVVVKDGKQIVQLADLLAPNDAVWAAKIQAAIKVHPKDLVGYTVTSIDGQEPVAWVKREGDLFAGLAKDSQTRFNQVTSRQGVAIDGSITTAVGIATSRTRVAIPTESTRRLTLLSPDGKKTLRIAVP
ncbi:hypothetical protein HK104_002935, partial [Borealophlyctis nickersoniae]